MFDHSDCGLPLSAQVGRLSRELAGRFGDGCRVDTVDLYSLEGSERDEALDAVVAGEPSPFVLSNGHLVCTGGLDIDVIVASVMAAQGPV